jgi:hypothetical protein
MRCRHACILCAASRCCSALITDQSTYQQL